MKELLCVAVLLICAVQARPNENLVFEDSEGIVPTANSELSTLPPFPKLKLEEDPVPTTYRPFPMLKTKNPVRFLAEELNSLAFDDGYVYEKPDIPFEDKTFTGYNYDRPKNPMELPSTTARSTNAPTTESMLDGDLPAIDVRFAY